jgi:hypothetical protein
LGKAPFSLQSIILRRGRCGTTGVIGPSFYKSYGREVIRQNKLPTPMSPTTPTQTSTCDMLAYSNPNAIGLLNTGGSELFRARLWEMYRVASYLRQ